MPLPDVEELLVLHTGEEVRGRLESMMLISFITVVKPTTAVVVTFISIIGVGFGLA